jgi:arylsulfatase A-like enzyme
MTGLFPPQHGVRSFCYERLPASIKTLAEVLRKAGYATITLRESEDVNEPGILEKVDVLRGFDTVVHNLADFEACAQEASRRGQPVFAFLHLWDLHAPYLYCDWAKEKELLNQLQKKAQVLSESWGVRLPDSDEMSEKAWIEFQRRVAMGIDDKALRVRTLLEWYVEGVTWFDRYRWPTVEATLKDSGLWDDTLIFVFADHGESIHPDGKGLNVVGHGQSLLDDVLRVPLLVHGVPGVESKQIRTQVSLADLAPTVLDALELEEPDPLGLDDYEVPHGRSLIPLLNSRRSGLESAPSLHFAELCRGESDQIELSPQYLYQRCVRGKGYKVLCHNGPIWMERYLNWQDWIARKWHGGLRRLGLLPNTPSVVVDDQADCDRLYWIDLKEDPDEKNPQSWQDKVPEVVVQMRLALDKLYEEPVRGPAIEYDGADETAVRERLAALGYIEE